LSIFKRTCLHDPIPMVEKRKKHYCPRYGDVSVFASLHDCTTVFASKAGVS